MRPKSFHAHRLITVMLAAVLGIASIGLAGCEKQTDEDLQNPDTSSETEGTAEMIKIYDHSDEVIPPETIRKEDAYQLCYNQNYNGRNGYPVSGWRYDNRGGPLQTEVGGGPGVLNDISEEYGVALIRDFNRITSGRIVTETSIKAMGEGVYLEYQDSNGAPLYRLTLRDDSWKLLNPDGGETVLMDHVFDDKTCTAAFRITLDLDKGTVVTVINHKDLGEYPLLSDSLGSFRFATEDKAKVSAAPGSINIVANYAAYEDFSQFGTQKVYDWETDGTVNINDSALLIRKGTSAKKNFSPIGGRVVAETKFLLKDDGAVDISLQSGNQTVLTFRAKSGMFSAGPEDEAQSEMLYEGRKNMWYRLRITADGNTGEAGIYINGRLAGSVPMATILPVDGVILSSAEGTASFDMLRVFGEVEHEDYVPAPAVKASFDDYVVGLNICSLWREGHHYGWSCIAPFAEPEPVLGYYDEGTPETADWEIKYMVEHGIDYQAFCWYADVSNGPLKNPRMSEHLHDGFQFAKYSDYMKYTLIWEAANAQHFDSYQFRNHVIPYWFENYFLDDRYLKIDNKIVLQIFGQDKLSDNTYFGSVAGVKAEFDYLRETAKNYGFDGVIIIGCSGRADDNYAAMGIDAVSAYNWGNAGNRYDVNKNSILTSAAASDKVYTIPTVSVGFDSIPWHGVRYGMISLEDYRAANEWVKNEYLPTHTEKGAWNDRLVMMSTWNEYGEGTYIMPCENLHGFGYLDVIRETFTDYGPADETVNLVPTAVQKERINHLFPQNIQHLRAQGWYGFGDSFDTTGHTVVKALEFTKETCSVSQIGQVKYDNGDMSGVSDPGKSDPIINFKKDCDLETADIDAVRITMQADAGTSVVLYFTTDGDGGLSESKTLRFVTDTNEMKSYVVKTGECSTWTGILKHVRLDPTTAADAAFTMRSIEFLTPGENNLPVLTINGLTCESKLPAEIINDTIAFPFDPGAAYDVRLNLFCTWSRKEGRLMLEGNHHTAVFTIGSDTCLADGKEMKLPYPLYAADGIPMLPMEILCEIFDFTWKRDGLECSITTPQYDDVKNKDQRVPGQWEFNGTDSEGWHSDHMSLLVHDGTMIASSTSEHKDPILRNSEFEPLEAEEYSRFEVRCRWHYNTPGDQMLTLYFITDKDGTWNESKTLKIELDGQESEEFVDLVYDLADQPLWNGTIKDIRFDPFNSYGEMELDYIRFVK